MSRFKGRSHREASGQISQSVDPALAAHANRRDNPHGVTAAQVGAVDNTAAINAVAADLVAHEARTDNPHAVTAAQVGALDAATFNDHSARHENGGADEISVAGLSGLLADAQTPLAHVHAIADVTNLQAALDAKTERAFVLGIVSLRA